MGFTDQVRTLSKRFKLDSHHAIERFGVVFGVLAVTGAFVLAGSGASALKAGEDALSEKAQYTERFTTSKTELDGDVVGIYANELRNKSLVMMKFDENAQISYNAGDYAAFLLGSARDLSMEKVATPGVTAQFHAFGSTGYVAVLLEADVPFERQVLNLTLRANAELSFVEQEAGGDAAEALAGDKTFAKYDQWRVFFNPGASGAEHLEALDAASFIPARAYYEIVLKEAEAEARAALESKLGEMRADLAQVEAYTMDLTTTKVDGVFLRPPVVPEAIRDDEITGSTAIESEGATPAPDPAPTVAADGAEDEGRSTLSLETDHVVPQGVDLDWRSGDIYDGYLDELVPAGDSYTDWLAAKAEEPDDDLSTQIANMSWMLSDGKDLKSDYRGSDIAMRPLMNVMNNLSQAYQDYYNDKAEYQIDLSFALLDLEVELRNVTQNSSIRQDADFLIAYY